MRKGITVELIIFVRGGPVFVALVGNHCQQIYIPKSVYTIISLEFIQIIPNLLPMNVWFNLMYGKLWLLTNIDRHELK